MKFPFAFLLLAHSSSAQNDVRHEDTNFLRSRKLSPLSEDCKILFIEFLPAKGNPDMEGQFACERTGGFIHRIEFFDDDQKERMMNRLKSGELLSGTSILKKESIGFLSEGDHDGVIYLPPGPDSITIETDRDLHRRRFEADVFGDKPILGVRVTDGDGKVYPHSAETMRDNIFGSAGDSVNLKSQLSACSHGQLNIVDMGVIDVTVSARLAVDGTQTMQNAVTAAVNAQLNITLPGPYEQVMYMMEGCYVQCWYGAYAVVNSWLSVYQNYHYYMTGVQVHELGHNFGMAHSGIQNFEGTGYYDDHTCMMGNPLYSDDVGRMCYNPAKNWYIGWYNNKTDIIDVMQDNICETKTIYGIANYDSDAASTVIVQLSTVWKHDWYVGFNRATGANADNDMADDEVTIVKTDNNGEFYSQSWLKAHLKQGESAIVHSSFDGVKVTVDTINIVADPGYAIVTFEGGTCQTANPTKSPTSSPVGNPTASPVTAPPTQAPTASPVTSPPTNAPTADDDDDGEECSDGEKFAVNARRKQKCNWLANRSNTNLIKQFCGKRHWKYNDGYGPPNKECRLTCDPYVSSCDSCFEYPKSRFFWKRNTIKNKDSFKTCGWLSRRRSERQKNQLCNQDSTGSFPKANVICPQTCNNCNR